MPHMREMCFRCHNPWDGTEVLYWGGFGGYNEEGVWVTVEVDIEEALGRWRWENREMIEKERENGRELRDCGGCERRWKGKGELTRHQKACKGFLKLVEGDDGV